MAGRDRLPLGLVVAFWAALYLPHLLTGDTLPARDVAATQLPWRTVWREQVLAGSPPLWDPYSNGGRPLLANPNTMAAYPGTLLFLLTSPERAAAWHIALHHLLLIVGCYRLARRTGAAPPGAAVATAATGNLRRGVVERHVPQLPGLSHLGGLGARHRRSRRPPRGGRRCAAPSSGGPWSVSRSWAGSRSRRPSPPSPGLLWC